MHDIFVTIPGPELILHENNYPPTPKLLWSGTKRVIFQTRTMHHRLLRRAVISSQLLLSVHRLVSGRDLALSCLKCCSQHKAGRDISDLSAITGYYCGTQRITAIAYEMGTSP